MTAERLLEILRCVPSSAEIRFTCGAEDNPHSDYYDVDDAYIIQRFDSDLMLDSILFLHGAN